MSSFGTELQKELTAGTASRFNRLQRELIRRALLGIYQDEIRKYLASHVSQDMDLDRYDTNVAVTVASDKDEFVRSGEDRYQMLDYLCQIVDAENQFVNLEELFIEDLALNHLMRDMDDMDEFLFDPSDRDDEAWRDSIHERNVEIMKGLNEKINTIASAFSYDKSTLTHKVLLRRQELMNEDAEFPELPELTKKGPKLH